MILTRLDLSDDENLRDCRAELNRALDISTLSPDGQMQQLGAFALWAAKWGEAMVAELETPSRKGVEFREAEEEATKAEERAEQLESAIEEAVRAMDAATDLKSEARAKAYEEIATDLEKAIAE